MRGSGTWNGEKDPFSSAASFFSAPNGSVCWKARFRKFFTAQTVVDETRRPYLNTRDSPRRSEVADRCFRMLCLHKNFILIRSSPAAGMCMDPRERCGIGRAKRGSSFCNRYDPYDGHSDFGSMVRIRLPIQK